MDQSERLHAALSEDGRFRLLVDAITDYAIYMLDADGHISSWNAGAQRLKGYTEHEIIGQHFSRFYTEEDRNDGLPARALRISAAEGKFEAEGWRVRKGGERFWAHVVIDPIFAPNGELLGYAKITRDVTELRAAQKALEETRERLLQSQKMEAIGQLTGGIAHDFNNLLMVVQSSLELLRKRLPPAVSGVELLDNAIQATQRGASLTQRMLAFARRQELKAKAVDVPELVLGMADLLQRSIGPSIHMETRFAIGLPKAYIDANQLELALVNLVVNARDAMPVGGNITIGARAGTVGTATRVDDLTELAAGTYLCVWVQDTGTGMDEATLTRAAEPFFTTKGVGKGTGLGLAMVHGFAAQSGGKLLLKSSPDAGTTAEIWLPVAIAEAKRASVVPSLEPKAATESLRIIAVDDDPLVLLSTAEMLRELGHEVIEVNSAVQALETLQSDEEFDLLIADQAMPGMTGLQLVGEVHRLYPGMATIIATGYAELPETGSEHFVRLSKPFPESGLAGSIDEALQMRRKRKS
ncbi:MAG: hybrid sensor histidine kinase/response regulator [Xanthobacteraceae bacterium]|jgi:PAS domain S-box-containing protein|nr:hybrid sensor histidine kinase/response regulator [Xanthobacteraceae bacterium]